MPSESVSASDPRLDPFREPSDGRRGPGDGLVVVEGELAVRRMLAAGHSPLVVAGTASHVERIAALGPLRCPLLVATHATLRDAVGFSFHRGLLAALPRVGLGNAPSTTRLGAFARQEHATFVVLVGLADPANVGTIIRSARALGADLVVCDAKGADPLGRKAIRASAGLCFEQELWLEADVGSALDRLREHCGAHTIALTPHNGAVALSQFKHPPHAALLLGNEGEGLGRALLEGADSRVCVDMANDVDSLNVASSATVTLWSRRVQLGGVPC